MKHEETTLKPHENFSQPGPEGCLSARVVGLEGTVYLLHCAGTAEPVPATVAGRLLYRRQYHSDLPVPGDWVWASQAPGGRYLILDRQDRKTHFSRSKAGITQVLAANLDVLFIVTGLDQNFNLNRIDRFVVQAREGGVTPVVVFNKTDLDPAAPERLAEATRRWPALTVVGISALLGTGLEGLKAFLAPGVTAAVVGSSGVGKSALVNRLLGADCARTGGVRASDGRGRHTTTSRHFYQLAGGAWLLDTPGLREVGLAAEDTDLEAGFSGVSVLARNCRFHDCRHLSEPGCAVLAAVENGQLSREQFLSWQKLGRETAYLDRQGNRLAEREEKLRWKKISKLQKSLAKSQKYGPDY